MRSQLTCAWSSVADLIELRKLRKAREGIDVAKLSKGDIKKKRKRPKEGEEEVYGPRPGVATHDNDEECVGLPCCKTMC